MALIDPLVATVGVDERDGVVHKPWDSGGQHRVDKLTGGIIA
jgi:hypothetical protein